MTAATDTDAVYYDPYDLEIDADPYPVYRRLREEAPLYYNEPHDFFAVSRADDVEAVLADHQTFISGRGAILDFIRADLEMPPGMLIFEDPPIHTRHRKLVSRVFTPRRMAALEPRIRAYAAASLDPIVGSGRFDFIADLGAQLPMRTIGMLLGIPEADQAALREQSDKRVRSKPGEPMAPEQDFASGTDFAGYIDWRAENPADDLMTDLLQVEFEDETGAVRRLTREEVLTYTSLIATAGNETSAHLIAWTGKVLADHPDQRRELVEDPSLIPGAIEEVLRFESPAQQFARTVSRDVELQGAVVPKDSVMMAIMASANRDDRRFPDGDHFDIHRRDGNHLSFGHGIHFCLGAALGSAGGPDRPRGDPEALPGLGDRPRSRPHGVGPDPQGLGRTARGHPVIRSRT